ncbi:hypothetical protein [Shinella zoogloeoides]
MYNYMMAAEHRFGCKTDFRRLTLARHPPTMKKAPITGREPYGAFSKVSS